jgi:subtilisin-like proprotein convertase family protein
MKSNFRKCISRLTRFLRCPQAPRPASRLRFRPALEHLEERALLSTLSVLNLAGNAPGSLHGQLARAQGGHQIGGTAGGTISQGGPGHTLVASSGSLKTTTSTSLAPSGPIVVSATDVPQRVDFPDVFTTSFVNVSQSATIAGVRVQLNITYPLDNDLTIDLIAPDGADVPLAAFEGSGANFQDTTFDDNAATPIGAGNSPFAGSYQPEGSLSSLAGLNAQGTWELQIIDWGGSSGRLNSWSLIIQPAGSQPAASSLTVGGFPSSTTAGAAGNLTVTALDAEGNVATGYTGTIHFTSSDPQAALPADYTFTAADAGSHTFSAALKTAGTQSLTVTDTGDSTLTGSETAISVSPAAASRLAVSAPSGVTAGVAFPVTVTAQDAYGNTATGYTGSVHFSSSDPTAGLPADYTFTASDQGVHTFAGGVTLQTAGSQKVTATDSGTGSITGSATVSVAASAQATRLAMSAPSVSTAGSTFSITVTALDANGHTATGYTGTVRLRSSDGQAILPANYTFTAADAGRHTFSVALKTAGSQTLTTTDTAHSTLTGSATVSVSPAAADHLAFGQQPTGTATGATINPAVTVRVLDAYNNLLTGDNTDSVTLTRGANPGGGTLQGTTTATVRAGIATFNNLTLTKPGNGYTLVASSGSLPTATSASFVVSSGIVFRATDVPQRVDFPDVFTTSFVNVPQSMAIAGVRVQLNITYPLDNDLTIDLIAPDGTDVPLAAFRGSGANFQDTTFDDNAATPIWAGNSPFAGSYLPEGRLSSLAGLNAQGTWELQIIDWGGSSGRLNSWSLIIQPAGSPNSLVGGSVPNVAAGTSRHAAPPTLAPTDTPPLAGVAVAGVNATPLPSTSLSAGNTGVAGQTNVIVVGPATVVPEASEAKPTVAPPDGRHVPEILPETAVDLTEAVPALPRVRHRAR